MNFIKSHFAIILILVMLVSIQACKTKKLAQKPVVSVDTAKKSHNIQATVAPKVITPRPVVAASKPAIEINNIKIQFEFDSSVLKTESYPVLDEVAAAMKASPSDKFILRGYASFEGTKEHNMILSEDRANSVRTYLINDGVDKEHVLAKGYGTSNPIADNNTESGRILNRRVEVGLLDVKSINVQFPVK